MLSLIFNQILNKKLNLSKVLSAGNFSKDPSNLPLSPFPPTKLKFRLFFQCFDPVSGISPDIERKELFETYKVF
ncbi:hypothetical protein MSBR3_0922 [Methanosarcina barkeri 3]|uniref:Uncharacterized protein n=1 Tax=Methanosarcina barkeri 3 TaxID=1434107 RepID=A0A0E3WXI3_METBA|nr:hypothetical protein MSBR3_0922 [Methanosarcina barkeri 3]